MDAVEAVRDELLAAVERGAGQDLRFAVGVIELEFAVELKHDAKVKAGFKAWVLSGDVEAAGARARTHRVKIALTPHRTDGRDLLVSSDENRTAGPGDVSEHLGR